MSYSRWSNSVWYTYWTGSSSKGIRGEAFCICGETFTTFSEKSYGGLITYGAMVDRDVIQDLKDYHEHLYRNCNEKPYTNEEYEELRGYMDKFMRNMERYYAEQAKRWRRKVRNFSKAKTLKLKKHGKVK